MCPCDSYLVSAPVGPVQVAGEYRRVWRGVYDDYRPFDVFHNRASGTYLFYWPHDLDWHIGTEICPCAAAPHACHSLATVIHAGISSRPQV
jgi:hypothetical protein